MENIDHKKGFTLIELLVVISIIGLLSSVVLGSLGSARQKAKNTFVSSSIQSYITALQAYYADHGYYPDPMHDDVQWACLGDVDYWCLFYNGRPSSDSPYFNNETKTYIKSWVDPSPYKGIDAEDGSRGAAFTCTLPDPDDYSYSRCLAGKISWVIDSSTHKDVNCGNVGGATKNDIYGLPICELDLK